MVYSDSIAVDHRNVRGVESAQQGLAWRASGISPTTICTSPPPGCAARRAILARSSSQRNGPTKEQNPAVAFARLGGIKRWGSTGPFSADERKRIAKNAAKARWKRR